jgi:hypothetical protein
VVEVLLALIVEQQAALVGLVPTLYLAVLLPLEEVAVVLVDLQLLEIMVVLVVAEVVAVVLGIRPVVLAIRRQ